MSRELDVIGAGDDWSIDIERERLTLTISRPPEFSVSPRQVSVRLPERFLDDLFRLKGQIRERIRERRGVDAPPLPTPPTPVPPKDDSLEEALRRACEERTLEEALAWIAVWDCDRAVRQALRNDAARREGREHPATSHGGLYETTFLVIFRKLIERWGPTA